MPKTDAPAHTTVLFEGVSDRLAFEAVARRLGVVLDPETVALVDLGGITNLRRRLVGLRSGPIPTRVLGLYDGAERGYVVRVLADSGMLDTVLDPAAAGFFGCERDLEEEVIVAAGPDLVRNTLAARGELTRFEMFQGQPAQRARTVEAQLHRFAGTAAGRKARFAADIVDALPIERMPRPLVALLEAVLRDPQVEAPAPSAPVAK
ncbi:TOPRIM nucleotidyl transferase/hydrolase domain-containing protein [Microbacterium aurantiacum]|uniref:TOPRIM nucleotidyl transferase/hydrolase domain-containing protein n=1 Tax=Microbacterium aurantiacum TaxID=162393 RepID=UPI000C80C168|nr:TOPRIM nucleotidyl transferase/hydrolase domain-containing protein [Microbacterium aurantiacum]